MEFSQTTIGPSPASKTMPQEKKKPRGVTMTILGCGV
jgi:hypothetical protein